MAAVTHDFAALRLRGRPASAAYDHRVHPGAFRGTRWPRLDHPERAIAQVLSVMMSGAMLAVPAARCRGCCATHPAGGRLHLRRIGRRVLGATLSIALGLAIPGFAGGRRALMAVVFAFLSLALILGLAARLDGTLSTNTIILVGVVLTMFANSIIGLIVTFAGDRVRTIMFLDDGLAVGQRGYQDVLLADGYVTFGWVILRHSNELNAFSLGEENIKTSAWTWGRQARGAGGGFGADRRERIGGRDDRLCGPGRAHALQRAWWRGRRITKAAARLNVCRRRVS